MKTLLLNVCFFSVIFLALHSCDSTELKSTSIEKSNQLKTEWSQISPYNNQCPPCNITSNNSTGRCAAGCGPIAAAQMIAYYGANYLVLDSNTNYYKNNEQIYGKGLIQSDIF